MSCGFCEESVSGLVVGTISLFSFIFIPIIEILIASIKLLIEKMNLPKLHT